MDNVMERAKALEEALKADEAFAADFKKAIDDRDAAAAIALAASKGIELVAEDFAPADAAAAEGKDVDESELDAVAGGYSWDEFMGDVMCYAYMLMATAAR